MSRQFITIFQQKLKNLYSVILRLRKNTRAESVFAEIFKLSNSVFLKSASSVRFNRHFRLQDNIVSFLILLYTEFFRFLLAAMFKVMEM